NGLVAHFFAQSHQGITDLRACTQPINHLDHAHQRDRVKKVITHDTALVFASLGNGGDGQRRRVGGQDTIGADDVLELSKQLFFNVQVFDNGLNHQIC